MAIRDNLKSSSVEIVTVSGEEIIYSKQVTKSETISVEGKTIVGIREVTWTSNGGDFATWMKLDTYATTFNDDGSMTVSMYHNNQYGTNTVQATYELAVL